MVLWPFLLTIEMWEFTTWVAKEPEGYQGEISEDIYYTKFKIEYSAKNFCGQSKVVWPNTSAFDRPMVLWPFLLTIEMWEFTTWVAKEPQGYQGEISKDIFNLKKRKCKSSRQLLLFTFLIPRLLDSTKKQYEFNFFALLFDQVNLLQIFKNCTTKFE